jgi:hypothetical protein
MPFWNMRILALKSFIEGILLTKKPTETFSADFRRRIILTLKSNIDVSAIIKRKFSGAQLRFGAIKDCFVFTKWRLE